MRWVELSKQFKIEVVNVVVWEVKMLCGYLEFIFRSVSKKKSYNLWNHWVASYSYLLTCWHSFTHYWKETTELQENEHYMFRGNAWALPLGEGEGIKWFSDLHKCGQHLIQHPLSEPEWLMWDHRVLLKLWGCFMFSLNLYILKLYCFVLL